MIALHICPNHWNDRINYSKKYLNEMLSSISRNFRKYSVNLFVDWLMVLIVLERKVEGASLEIQIYS
jgi:hypothetical protein